MFPYPYANTSSTENKNKEEKESTVVNGIGDKQKESNSENIKGDNRKKNDNEPIYHIVHRGVIDFQNFTNARYNVVEYYNSMMWCGVVVCVIVWYGMVYVVWFMWCGGV